MLFESMSTAMAVMPFPSVDLIVTVFNWKKFSTLRWKNVNKRSRTVINSLAFSTSQIQMISGPISCG
ncbi:hypothetical protein AVEN_172530-1 [Araneus ventricosus]|uniref:Uncharacterized protein n=1 Tax=Araneus ventricosus TaxID=182803 RepID=A0A4Y2K411_ARAVE|nr:hypothetical protein AVEN_172530-1 [Araneus ventricosus]